ncbi:MAG: hypothetical protein WBQ18_20210 [Solirubrobacteraceae bacterium]
MSRSPLNSRARRAGALTALLVVCCGALAAVLGASALARTTHAHLVLLQRNPAIVQGRGFAPRKLVRVTLTNDGSRTRSIRASRTGTFSVTFPTTISACTAWSIAARQAPALNVTVHSGHLDCAPL